MEPNQSTEMKLLGVTGILTVAANENGASRANDCPISDAHTKLTTKDGIDYMEIKCKYWGYVLETTNMNVTKKHTFKLKDGILTSSKGLNLGPFYCSSHVCMDEEELPTCDYRQLEQYLGNDVDLYNITSKKVKGQTYNSPDWTFTNKDWQDHPRSKFYELSGTCALNHNQSFTISCDEGDIALDRWCPEKTDLPLSDTCIINPEAALTKLTSKNGVDYLKIECEPGQVLRTTSNVVKRRHKFILKNGTLTSWKDLDLGPFKCGQSVCMDEWELPTCRQPKWFNERDYIQLKRYRWNDKTQQCEDYTVQRGMMNNANQFVSMQDCKRTCDPQAKPPQAKLRL